LRDDLDFRINISVDAFAVSFLAVAALIAGAIISRRFEILTIR